MKSFINSHLLYSNSKVKNITFSSTNTQFTFIREQSHSSIQITKCSNLATVNRKFCLPIKVYQTFKCSL